MQRPDFATLPQERLRREFPRLCHMLRHHFGSVTARDGACDRPAADGVPPRRSWRGVLRHFCVEAAHAPITPSVQGHWLEATLDPVIDEVFPCLVRPTLDLRRRQGASPDRVLATDACVYADVKRTLDGISMRRAIERWRGRLRYVLWCGQGPLLQQRSGVWCINLLAYEDCQWLSPRARAALAEARAILALPAGTPQQGPAMRLTRVGRLLQRIAPRLDAAAPAPLTRQWVAAHAPRELAALEALGVAWPTLMTVLQAQRALVPARQRLSPGELRMALLRYQQGGAVGPRSIHDRAMRTGNADARALHARVRALPARRDPDALAWRASLPREVVAEGRASYEVGLRMLLLPPSLWSRRPGRHLDRAAAIQWLVARASTGQPLSYGAMAQRAADNRTARRVFRRGLALFSGRYDAWLAAAILQAETDSERLLQESDALRMAAERLARHRDERRLTVHRAAANEPREGEPRERSPDECPGTPPAEGHT